MSKQSRFTSIWAVIILCCISCQQEKVFKKVSPQKSKLDFVNRLIEGDSMNAILYEYVYNGAGVAAGDFNGDGLRDLVFAGNQVSSQLYLNRGELNFEVIGPETGLSTDRWCNGVAVADVNQDGKLDIYFSVAGHEIAEEQKGNLLFINQGWDEDGVPSFKEEAEKYGLADRGYSIQAAFVDYDKDGDLDMYLLSNAMERNLRSSIRPKRVDGRAPNNDRLFRNNGDETFTNVSKEAGIVIEGYALGIRVCDLNGDNWPDIYVANDFLTNDLVWINQQDGTFTNKAADYLRHQSHNGMGVDVADFNNDLLPDIGVLDMLPEDNYRQKMMLAPSNYDLVRMEQQMGYEDQYVRNTLQLNRGALTNGEPRFSEIGFLSGVAATDWSWGIFFADLDNDQFKDIYISNGYRKDVTNLDYINYSKSSLMFGTDDSKEKRAVKNLNEIPEVEISNYCFRNDGSLRFEDVTKKWGVKIPSFSNGAIYVDLDNDGDLEIVTNNIDSEAFLFENFSSDREGAPAFLNVSLKGNTQLPIVHNTKVYVYHGGKTQYQEFSPFKGFKSTVDDRLHFGLGKTTIIDSIRVVWPDASETKKYQVKPNQFLVIEPETKRLPSSPSPEPSENPLFELVQDKLGLEFVHDKQIFTDFKSTRTVPHDLAQTGPPLVKGDLNQDGREDIIVGGNKGQAARIFLQNEQAGFIAKDFEQGAEYQDVAMQLFDVDGDGDLDLYVGSGGISAPKESDAYQDRLYLNDGKANFQLAVDALPKLTLSTACVVATDLEGDGDMDLFVGGRVIPGNYPLPAPSYLLENEGGKFKDISPEEFQELGLVTDAKFTDLDQNGTQDLIVIGEWMPIKMYLNQGGTLSPYTPVIQGPRGEVEYKTEGWWFHINEVDIDQDGDLDYILGNLGLNAKLRADQNKPVQVFAADFDKNGAIDPLLSCYIGDDRVIMHERDLLIDQIPAMKRRFPNYEEYAYANLDQILSLPEQASAYKAKSYHFASVILENLAQGSFRMHELPTECQFSPILSSIVLDLNQDKQMDLLLAGNLHSSEASQIGFYDASYGTILLNQGKLNFEMKTPHTRGMSLDGDLRKLIQLPLADGSTLFVGAYYGEALKAWRSTAPQM